MAFSDPVSVVIGGGTLSLPRVQTGPTTNVYSTADQTTKLTIAHAYNKRVRHQFRIDNQKIEPDPLFPETNKPFQAAGMLIVDCPLVGYSVAELAVLVEGVADTLLANSSAYISKLLGGES
jgi:hypothetical protein